MGRARRQSAVSQRHGLHRAPARPHAPHRDARPRCMGDRCEPASESIEHGLAGLGRSRPQERSLWRPADETSLMTRSAAMTDDASGTSRGTPVWTGWLNVVVAALIMLATLPGRTQGLGLITEPMLRGLQIDRGTYAHPHLWGTLL